MLWLILLLIVKLCQPCWSASGLLWDKYREKFVPILSISKYAQVYDEAQTKIRQALEPQIEGRVIVIKYYDHKNVLEFNDEATKISGPFGELWNSLSEYLNFTIRPIRINSMSYEDDRQTPTKSKTSLLFREQSPLDVIPYINCNNHSQSHVDCTMPILKTSVRLYIRLISRSDKFWIFKVLQPTLQLITVAVWFILCLAGIIAQRVYNRWNTKKIHLSLLDRIFYVFSSHLSQGWQPPQLEQESKILVYSNKMFGWYFIFLVNWVFRDFLISTTMELPFRDLKSLLDDTEYHVLQLSSSVSLPQLLEKHEKRITTLYSREDMFESICSSDGEYAALDEEHSSEYSSAPCALVPIGEFIEWNWIASGIAKGFPYLHTINKGILRMHENGMIKMLMNRVELLPRINNVLSWESIDFEHVYMMYVWLASGTLAAIICCICEHIVFWHQQNRKNKPPRFNNQKRKFVRQF